MFRLFFSIPDARSQFSLSLFLSTALELRKSFLPVWQTRNLTVKILTVCTVVDAVDGDDVVVQLLMQLMVMMLLLLLMMYSQYLCGNIKPNMIE